jgi:hypothetical protein
MKSKWIKKAVLLILACCTMFSTAACGENLAPPATVDENYEWLDKTVKDTSDLSAWDQENRMDLVAWDTTASEGKLLDSSNNVVYDEIERVTGVTIDLKNSFDNQGSTADVQYGKLSMTGNMPDISYGTFLDPEAVYDLTELIDKYCPTIKARMPISVWNDSAINGGVKGKVYAVPYRLGGMALPEVDAAADPQKCLSFSTSGAQYYPYVYVREDILKDAFPNAHTEEELQEIFRQNGKFTEEELFDVTATSAEKFRTEFIPRIYDTIRANEKYRINSERWTEVMLTHNGFTDTWNFGKLLTNLLGATDTSFSNMFTYWDAAAQEIRLQVKQDFYKAEVKAWVDMMSNGRYVSQYGFNTTKAALDAELNKGYYAVCYRPNTNPTGLVATLDNGTKVKYRRVYLKIEHDANHFEYMASASPNVHGVSFYKDSVREADLPQLLRWLDYQCSELADKLYSWGPESAGLFEYRTVDGEEVRRYKDADLAEQMVYSTVALGAKVQQYNLSNGTRPSAQHVFSFVYGGASKDHARCTYDLSSISDLWTTAYVPSVVCRDIPELKRVGKLASIERWTNNDLAGVEELWAKRPQIETALMNVFTSGANFNNAWNAFTNTLNTCGWTDQYFSTAYTDAFLALNEDYLGNLLKS